MAFLFFFTLKQAMNRLLLLLLLFALSANAQKARLNTRPNIVLILADDLGWADLGCYRNSFNETPALDSLAKRGVRFTQGYSTCPVCSPSRSSIMTGKTPIATGVTDWLTSRKLNAGSQPTDQLIAADTKQFMALEETTIAEVLRQNGYRTGLFGKWHLGEKAYWPEQQGFEVAAGKPHGGSPLNYFYPYKNGSRTSEDLTPTGQEGEYLTDRLTDEAIKFMEAGKDRPFFAFLSHHAVHTPLQPKPELLEKYRRKLGGHPEKAPENPHYAALLESLDQSVGKVMAYLKASGLDQNTIVVFTSDNGGLAVEEGKFTPATVNTPLRAGKGHVYEGGIRVPFIVYAPKATPHVEESVVWGADFFPTFLDMAGIANPNPEQMEGQSFARLLNAPNVKPKPRRLLWHYPHYSNQKSSPAAAIREGDWKLVQQFEGNRLELYNLKTDPSEQTDQAAQQPARLKALLAQLDTWRKRHNALMPTPKP
ncbi:MAG: DUF4976 domain-containing protein [Cytophagales bacterium]|nr:MAG: DUF4976 domain-containing protein [Cytophagales bacterium]